MEKLRDRVTALILNTGGSPEVVAGILAIVAEDREKLVAALFDALTCVECKNCTKHYEQMRSARDADIAVKEGK